MFPSLEVAICPACGTQWYIHVLCCVALGRYTLQKSLLDSLAYIFEAEGFTCLREQAADGSGQHPGYFLVAGFDRVVDMAVVASVVHPLQLQADFSEDCGAFAARRGQQKDGQ